MDFKKFLEMSNESLVEAKKESTAEKDDKAEKAGKKVAKDIEYDEGHKGKDDKKAEKAGKKVAKDIEYDDKKDKKKKSLKDWFEQVDKEIIAEAIPPGMKPMAILDPKNKSAGAGVLSSTNPAIQKLLGNLDPKDVKIVMTTQAQPQTSTPQPPTTPATGAQPAGSTAMQETELDEKWAGDAKVKPTGQYKDKSKEELKAMLAKLHKSGPHGKDSPAAKKMRQINFALRAKGGWKSGEGAAMKEEKVDEKFASQQQAKLMYAVAGDKGVAKKTGVSQKTAKEFIKKSHGQKVSQLPKKVKEAEIPSSAPDYGAGLGTGRNDKVLEAKPDFIDLDKDGNKKESMKKAAADKKKKQVKESMNTLEAAYHEGKSHGLSKHSYACRYDEGSEEHKRYHDGFKEGLDECYGLMPNRGLIVSEIETPATVPGMADQAEKEMDEGNAFTAALAKTPKGGKFTVGGETFTDKSNYNAKVDEYAFESLDKQLNELLKEDAEQINEGLSVNMSQGLGGPHGDVEDSVSVTAQGEDAAKLLAFIKQVGLGGLGDAGGDKPMVGGEEPVVAVASDYGAPKFGGYDSGMMDLIKKVSDHEGEEGHEHGHGEEEVCGECGMMETKCGCEKEVVDEVQSEDQMEYQVAEDDGEGNIAADEQGAQIDSHLPAKGGATNEDGAEAPGSVGADAVDASDQAEEEEEAVSESTKLDEWANEAGHDGTEASFERDIEFMTKVISGGLNKPKSTGQTTIPVIAHQDARTGDEDVAEWKRLAGLGK